MNAKVLGIIVVIVVAAVAGEAYLSGMSSKASNSENIPMQIIGGVGPGTEDIYSPENITVTMGKNVTLSILNTDDNQHGIIIPGLGVPNTLEPPGDTIRISFVANQTGVFEYTQPAGDCKGGVGNVCNSVQHMWGYITVVSP